MKKIAFTLIIMYSCLSCNKQSKLEQAVIGIPLEIKVERFDKLFFETSPQNLNDLKNKFPFFFPKGTPDSVWIEKMQNPLWRELYGEVQKKFADFAPIEKDINSLFKHIKFFFPDTKTPKVISVISEMDYTNKIIYADSLLIISMELYLGKNHKFYEYPIYLKQNFEPKQILPDIVSSFSIKKIEPLVDTNLLSQMIYNGKQLYLKDILLPEYSDAEKVGYTTAQNTWCVENESYMWRYFLENELLYSNDPKLGNRFINPAPFSKFYLEIDNESPGQVGAWIGWQMVRSFMSNNNVPLEQMLKMNAKELFEKSKYKPNKNGN